MISGTQDERHDRAVCQRLDRAVQVRARQRPGDQSGAPGGRPGYDEQNVHERPAMEIQGRRSRSSPRNQATPARDHQRPDAAPPATIPRHQSTAQQRPADGQVGHRRVELARLVRNPFGSRPQDQPGRHERDAQPPHERLYTAPANVARRGPDSSAFAMNPRALLWPSRLRYDDASRLDVSTTAGGGLVAGELIAHREPVDVGQLHVQQHQRRLQRTRRRQRRGAVDRLADDLEPAGLQQRPSERPEVR